MRRPATIKRYHWAVAIVGLASCIVPLSGCGEDQVNSVSSAAVPTPSRGGGVAIPALEGPVSGGAGKPFLASTTVDLAQVGYSEAEYFISGSATSYENVGGLGTDGKWTITPGSQADYKTRIVVYRPTEPAKFNGTVIVEWLNVSGGVDAAADWLTGHTQLIRDGCAWVGVSAQYVGVEGGPSLLGLIVAPLKKTDPERYGSLVHPGDSFSYDIFSQTAQAIRRPSGTNPLAGLPIRAVIGAGDSQSAFRLVTYINAVQPVADIYDGFLVHSRGGSGISVAALSEAPQKAIGVPGTALIRTDLDAPVLIFETETDLTFLGYAKARQPDGEAVRVWEVAGTAHADTYTTGVGSTDLGTSPDAANLVLTTTAAPGVSCDVPINSGPQHFVFNAALAALNRWVRQGTPPPAAPRLTVAAGSPVTLVRDGHGNALGGIRTPQVDVPIATLAGELPGLSVCSLFGQTVPFDSATLASLYPTHAAYVSEFGAATDQAVQAGFLLQPDAALMKAAAAASNIGQ